ncbi:MAG: thiamine pyrophosphate-dependent enzyme [Patescibacteria group bacterium]|nr:thiamine pyrophosphate-dependent enzyme [Patescibacteria group bacterium]
MISAFDQLGFDESNTAILSGIGCTARSSGYLKFDSINAIHGRSLPIAEGLKKVQPDKNVVVFSGDGDLTGIGGNHLLHSARRNSNITVIMNNNLTFGLTGGQLSPMAPRGTVSPTSPKGSSIEPVNIQGLVASYNPHFFSRGSVVYPDKLSQTIKQALEWPHFSFVEVVSVCPTNYYRRLGFKSVAEVYQYLQKNLKFVGETEKLEPGQLGIVKKELKQKEEDDKK